MFVPERIKIGSGASAYYLDPNTQYSNWQNCTTGIGAQDSTCVVPYRYGVAAGLATITASFSKANPTTTGTGTKLIWTSTNAARLTVNCSGVATYVNANAPLQNSPAAASIVTLTSPTVGVVSCLLTAYNSDNEPTSTTVTATFVLPVPLTLTAGFSPATTYAGGAGSSLVWTSTGAKNVYVEACTGLHAGSFGPGYVPLQAAVNVHRFPARPTSPGQVTCAMRATNDEGQTVYSTAVLNFVMPPAPSVSGSYNPPNINVGQQSQLLYSSSNAVYVGLVCTGINWLAVASPSMFLNQNWYWFTETWNNPGTQDCGIQAINQAGQSIIQYFSLVVAPTGNTASGGGPQGSTSNPAAGMVYNCQTNSYESAATFDYSINCGAQPTSSDDGPSAAAPGDDG